MPSLATRLALTPISYLFTDKAGSAILRLFARRLIRQFTGAATDKFLGLLLSGMDLAFLVSKDYRRNIRNFSARYLFTTRDKLVAATAIFSGGDMKYEDDRISDWDVKVTFKNTQALVAFLFSKDQDILNSLLANEVEVDGNLNLLYKFGFMARDLAYRLGVR